MILVLEFLRTKLGQYILIGASAVAAFLVFVSHERSVGSRKAVAKIEQQDAVHVTKAQAAAKRSADPAARGVRDPYVRADD
jgi:hypothetical protein